MAHTFYKRPGTTDKGKDYEDFCVANFVLRLISNKQIENFQISSNDENFGAFDDIVLEYRTINKSDEKYALQLKHVRAKTLTLKALTEDSGNYSIKKYFKSYQQFKKHAKNYQFALLTNAKFEAKNGTKIEFFDENEKIQLKAIKCAANSFINTSQKSDKCYKFHVENNDEKKLDHYEDFFKIFFLYPNQANVDQVKTNTITGFQKMFSSSFSVGEKYLHFVSEWSIREGVKEKLDGDMMRRVIGIQVLSPFIQSLVFGSVNSNIKLLQEVIDTFRVTLFHEGVLNDVRKIWGDAYNILDDFEKINSFCTQYQLSSKNIKSIDDLTDSEFTKLLWLMEKCPLIVTENPSTLHVLDLCINQKFVLVGDQLSKLSTFQNLSDIISPVLFEKITNNFKCSLQGKQEVRLQVLIKQNESIKNIVTTNELLHMANNLCVIGGQKELLPTPYIERSLCKNVIDIKFLESVDNDTTIVISNYSKTTINEKKFQIISIEEGKEKQIQNLDLVDDFSLLKVKVYVTEKELSIQTAKSISWSRKFHYFRMNDDGHLEWIFSKNSVNYIDQYAIEGYFMEETDLLTLCKNKICIVNGDPGMGKSVLLCNLKNNFPTSIWTIIFSSKDISSLYFYIKQTENQTDAFINYIMNEKYRHLKIFDKNLLKLLIDSGYVAFFWDALDEISEQELQEVTNFIITVKKKCYKQIVTSRPHLVRILEKKFVILSNNLTQFGTQQQVNYMEKRFHSFYNEESLKNLVEQIRKHIVETDSFAVLSIPIQIFMLTELFLQNPDKYKSLLEGILSITDLYHHFIEESFVLYFRDKANVSSPNHILQQALDLEKKYRVENYEILSLLLLFGKDFTPLEDTNIEDFLQQVEQEGDSCGFILEVTKTRRVVFVHSSYAEYFAASYLSKHSETWQMLKDVIFNSRYTNVRLFFDLLLAKNRPAHVAVLQKNLEAVKRYQNLVQSRDLGGRTPLHLACSWGVRYPVLKVKKQSGTYLIDDTSDNDFTIETESTVYIDILKFLLERCSVYEKDFLFNLDPKSYAEKLNCLVTLMTMKKKHGFRLPNSYLVICNILYYSVKFGDAAALSLFDDAKYVVTKSGGRSLLHFAVLTNNKNCVQRLLLFDKYRESVDFLDHFGSTTPLLLACINGYEDIVELLVAYNAKVNRSNERNLTPLHLAASNGYYKIVVTLIKHGACVNTADINKVTPLHFACEGAHDDIIEFLLLSNADGNTMTKTGVTPLSICANKGYSEAALLLIEGGVSVNLPIKDGRTPLHLAAYCGYQDIVDSLIAHGATTNSVESQNGYTPLHVASAHGYLQVVKSLLQEKANPNCIDKESLTPLYLSSQNGHVEVVATLLTFKANTNIYTTCGVTPLLIACRQENIQIVEILLKHGANVDFRADDGWTPLYVACSCRNLKIVDCLLKWNANPNIGDTNGLRPLHVACFNNSVKIVELLLMYKADVNVVDVSGVRPFHVAVDKDCKEIVELLIEARVDVEASVKRGWKGLHIACSRGFVDIVGVLVEAGVKVDEGAVEVAKSKGYGEVVEVLNKAIRQRGRQSNRCILS